MLNIQIQVFFLNLFKQFVLKPQKYTQCYWLAMKFYSSFSKLQEKVLQVFAREDYKRTSVG